MAKKRSNKKALWIILGSVFVLLIVAVGLIVAGGNKAIKVTTAKVERRTITQSVSAIGKIEAETEVKISSQTSGEVIFLGVKEGDTVKSRDLLVRINPDIVESQVEQYEAGAQASKIDIAAQKASMDKLSADLKRAKELYEKKYLSRQDYDQAIAAYDQAVAAYDASKQRYEQSRGALKQIQRSLARTAIYAPINGIVTALNVEKGEKVVGTDMMAGTEMLRISDLNVMNAVVDVDENDIVMVKIGDTATVEVDAITDKKLKGVVIEIGHSAEASATGTQNEVTNFSVKVRILDPEARLRPGMSCNVEIQTETKPNVLAIPLQSVTIREAQVQTGGKPEEEDGPGADDAKESKKAVRPPSVVFVKKGNAVKMLTVTTGISDKGYIEIISGLKVGDVVVSGSYSAISKDLQDGSEIKVDAIDNKKKK